MNTNISMRKTTYLFIALIVYTSCKKQGVNVNSDVEWSRIFGGSGNDVGYSAVESANGGYVIVGYTNSNDGDLQGKNHCTTYTNIQGQKVVVCGRDDGWVIKIGSSGARTLSMGSTTFGGADTLPFPFTYKNPSGIYVVRVVYPNANSDRFSSIAVASAGKYLIAGQTNAWINDSILIAKPPGDSFPVNPTNVWIVSMDDNGSSMQNTFHDVGYDSVNCIKAISNGKYILVGIRDHSRIKSLSHQTYVDFQGSEQHFSGLGEAFIITDISGTTKRTYLGGGSYDRLNSITQLNDGSFIAVGQTSSTDGDLSASVDRGENDFWVVKLNANGVPVNWKMRFGGAGDDIANAVAATADGGFIVAGQTNSNDGEVIGNHSSSCDAWVIRFKANGDTLWKRTYGGAFGDDIAKSIVQTQDGGFVFAGQTSSNDGDVSGNHGYSDAWIVKIDENGKIVWQKTLGGSSADGANNLIKTSDGGLLITGYSNSNDGDISEFLPNSNLWVFKLKKQ